VLRGRGRPGVVRKKQGEESVMSSVRCSSTDTCPASRHSCGVGGEDKGQLISMHRNLSALVLHKRRRAKSMKSQHTAFLLTFLPANRAAKTKAGITSC
jgi:hypothetical protein